MHPVLTFSAVIRIRGANPYVLVSAPRAKALKPGWRKPLPVRVRVNGKPGKPWRINMMPAGDGTFYLYLHGRLRKVSCTGVGDRVKVEIAFDADYAGGPEHPLPLWFDDALTAAPTARENWEALAPSRKKEIVRYFVSLKSPAARQRNLARAMSALSGERARFMARSWGSGA